MILNVFMQANASTSRLQPCALPLSQDKFACKNQTENVSQLLFVDFHCSFHGQKQRKETTEAKKPVFSTCRFLSFQGVF